MTTAIKRRRGTTTEHATFTGLIGELTIDTTKNTVIVHDGSTAGGFSLAKENNTTLTGTTTLSGGTANGVTYLNGSKVLTSGSALTFDGTNLGVGGAAAVPLDVYANASALNLRLRGRASDSIGQMEFWNNAGSTRYAFLGSGSNNTQLMTSTATPFLFGTNTAERMRIDSAGNVGIGTTSPTVKLDVVGAISATEIISANKGITFPATQVASANANTLDDYEEGTWTATITTTGTDFTTAGRVTTGHYTKIGRQVTALFGTSITNPTGGTGTLVITGLPFATAFASISSAIDWGRVDLPGAFTAVGVIPIAAPTRLQFLYPVSGADRILLSAADLNGNTTPFIFGSVTYFV